MTSISYQKLTLASCDRIREIDASQYIRRAYREVDGVRQLVDIHYQDPDYPEGFENHYHRLQKTITQQGFACGAFSDLGHLVGFISVNRGFFGTSAKYVLLDQLFISLPYRGQGIGKSLLKLATDEALTWGADKFYICAGSAEETLAFYFSCGSREALEIQKELYESDPRDVQLELTLCP